MFGAPSYFIVVLLYPHWVHTRHAIHIRESALWQCINMWCKCTDEHNMNSAYPYTWFQLLFVHFRLAFFIHWLYFSAVVHQFIENSNLNILWNLCILYIRPNTLVTFILLQENVQSTFIFSCIIVVCIWIWVIKYIPNLNIFERWKFCLIYYIHTILAV